MFVNEYVLYFTLSPIFLINFDMETNFLATFGKVFVSFAVNIAASVYPFLEWFIIIVPEII